MADQDFDINIRTIADVTGVRKAADAIAILNEQAKKSQAEAAAGAAGGAAGGGRSEADALAERIEHGFIRTGVHAVGIGFILEFVGALKKASEEVAKISEELDKQGAQLVKNAQLEIAAATHAKDESDVLKVSNETLKDIETTKKTLDDLSQKDLNWAAKASDLLQKQMLARQRAAGMGDYEAARQEELKTAYDQYQAARQRAMDELLKAEDAENQTFEEKEARLNNEIAEQEKLKAASLANTDPGGYAKAANNLLKLNKELEETVKLEDQRRNKEQKEKEATEAEHEKDIDFLEKQIQRAPAQVQRTLMDEQAAAVARAEGRGRDTALFLKDAEALKRGMTPQQKEQLGRFESNKDVVEAINRLADKWQ